MRYKNINIKFTGEDFIVAGVHFPTEEEAIDYINDNTEDCSTCINYNQGRGNLKCEFCDRPFYSYYCRKVVKK